MMRKIILIMTLHFFVVSFSQEKKTKLDKLKVLAEKSKKEIDSFKKINFLEKNYLFLNKDFKINIHSINFNKAVRKYKYYPEKINSYKDSLSVILTYELGSYHGSRMAKSRITFEWKKVGFYIWQDEAKAKEIGLSFGFSRPYDFYQFLISKKNKSIEKNKLLKKIQLELNKSLNSSINIVPNKRFLKFAFKNNKDRIEAMNNYINLNNKHKH